MINKFIWFLIVIILLLSVTPAPAQPNPVNGYAVQHFTDENGLPQNSINDLLFDKDGYLWLASQVGLVRFNGSSFKIYYPDDKPVMESNIALLGKDGEGSLYFQTTDHHLYCNPGNKGKPMDHLNTPETRQPLLLNASKQLFDFTSFLKTGRSATESRQRRSIFLDLFDHNERFFVTDARHVYMIDRDSLYYFDGQELHNLAPLSGQAGPFFTAGNHFYELSRDSVMADYEDGKKIRGKSRIENDPRQAISPTMQRDRYRVFSCGKVNHLMAGSMLYRLFPQENGLLRAVFLVNLDFIPNISAVEYNAGLDLLLIATNTEGFYFLRRNRFLIDGWSQPMREEMDRHLFGPMVLYDNREILTDKFIFTPAGAFAPVKGRGPIWQRCLYIDRKKQVWGAFDSLPQKRTTAMDLVATFASLGANIIDYTEDPAGQLYCLTERALWQVDGQNAFRQLYRTGELPGMQDNEVMAFTGPNRLWIGNTNGMIEYDPEKKQGHLIPELSGKHVRAIHCCRDGSVLIGTYGQGYLYYFHGRFFPMPLDKNGFLVTAHCFLEDAKGNVWIPCNKGLFKVPKADMDAWVTGQSNQLYYYYYGRQDGLLTNEFNGGFNTSGIITPEGFIALLSMKGMVCFYADSLETDFPQGAIDMTELDIDGKPAPRTDTINLSPGYNSLVLNVACPYLGNRNNLYLQYNLAGLNDEWKEIPEDGLLNFSRLSSGSYSLRVRKVNGFGKNNYQYRQWEVMVAPYFYRTTWFQCIIALLVLVLLGVLVQLRLKLVEKKKEIRVKADKLKGAVVRLEETVTKLQHSEQALLHTSRQREKLISLVIHDLRSPLRFLTMLAGDLHDNQGNFSPAELKDRTYWVKKGTQDVYNFSEDFLLWVTSQKDNFKISKQLFFIRPLLQEIYDFYLEQVLQKGNQLTYEADGQLQLYSDPHLLITIIRNLTDNANKYTEQGIICITAKQEGCYVLITVADNGKGMSSHQVAAFLGHDSLDNVKSGSQLGHKFIFDLTKRLDGVLTVESGESIGTTVCLRIPIEPEREPVPDEGSSD